VTRGTPHLGTPGCFEDEFSALGTRFGILGKEFDRLHIPGITLMILELFFITILADVFGTQTALPLSG